MTERQEDPETGRKEDEKPEGSVLAAPEETAHLLRSPANAERLMESIEAAEAGLAERKKLPLGA